MNPPRVDWAHPRPERGVLAVESRQDAIVAGDEGCGVGGDQVAAAHSVGDVPVAQVVAAIGVSGGTFMFIYLLLDLIYGLRANLCIQYILCVDKG